MYRKHFTSSLGWCLPFLAPFMALLALIASGPTRAVTPTVDAQVALAASDAIRNPTKPFSLEVVLTEYTDGKQTDTSTLQVYSRADAESGQFRSLIRFQAPARDANKLMLKSGNDLWFFDPASKASVRISPQQRLLGQAANGDVVTVNMAKGYQATLEGEDTVQDGDRQRRLCIKLNLLAKSSDMTYHRAEMWLDAQSNRPVKARFYSESNSLLKTAFYRAYRAELGAERPTQVVIIDGLNPKWVTVMHYGAFSLRDIPEAWMQREYLPRFKPE